MRWICCWSIKMENSNDLDWINVHLCKKLTKCLSYMPYQWISWPKSEKSWIRSLLEESEVEGTLPKIFCLIFKTLLIHYTALDLLLQIDMSQERYFSQKIPLQIYRKKVSINYTHPSGLLINLYVKIRLLRTLQLRTATRHLALK